ncbi:6117_t:CDS:1 [Gigaspora rosea]|nr:6117_t:CDS:1 [Gigaspora rosea]
MSVTSNSTICGIPAFIDPKCFGSNKYKSHMKSDVYSFGVSLGNVKW